MGFRIIIFLFLFLSYLHVIFSQETSHAIVIVDGDTLTTETDDNFICATIDWWPHDKCNYNQCPWGYTSVINMNLFNPILAKAIQAFKPLRLRVGGSLQDRVLYDTGNLGVPCHQFQKTAHGLFGFSEGCLHMSRWDELNDFFSKTNAVVTFGLNALFGRHQGKKSAWVGDWDPSNARDFLAYTISKGYTIDSWEFGNELSGQGVGARVGAEQYAKDVKNLKSIIDELYSDANFKPSLVAPGGFFERDWFAKFLKFSGPDVVNILTHHIYNLGPGNDPNLVSKILNPEFLSRESKVFDQVQDTISTNGPWASAWVGEAGGAYNSGGRHVSDTFVDSFWYLDQLGMAAKFGTKVYCRQSLVGGNYGLLNTTTFFPNPDYYSALLWHRLMGKGVLPIENNASPYLRTYAHCSKGREGITLLVINLSNQTNFIIKVYNGVSITTLAAASGNHKDSTFVDSLKRTISWVGMKTSDISISREEYHLTPKDGYLRSQTMVLNGVPLELTEDGEIPSLDPIRKNIYSPIYIAPLSIAFIAIPSFDAPVCK